MVADALREHRALVPPAEQDVMGSDGDTLHRAALVFTRADGTAAYAEKLRKPFAKARKATGLPASARRSAKRSLTLQRWRRLPDLGSKAGLNALNR
ncbi:hypothetical protein [Actinoallomurus acaciae]|uniref:Uncharacterized protein n=1 Tax=Actinoallomurus acaciae TaxID=502577 RepID=A0ABV5YD05_9ACTN